MRRHFIYEVQINWAKDPYGDDSIEWLLSNNLKPDRDWQIDMHGGTKGYLSFWFHDANKAMIVKLTLGGM